MYTPAGTCVVFKHSIAKQNRTGAHLVYRYPHLRRQQKTSETGGCTGWRLIRVITVNLIGEILRWIFDTLLRVGFCHLICCLWEHEPARQTLLWSEQI